MQWHRPRRWRYASTFKSSSQWSGPSSEHRPAGGFVPNGGAASSPPPSRKGFSMSTIFDPAAFLDQTTEQVSERRPPLPAIDYNAIIKDVKSLTWQSKDKVDEVSGTLKSGLKFEPVLELDLPLEVQETCKIKKMTLTDGIMVELNETKTAIDYGIGKNNRLRMYRDATGLNNPGQSFSPRMLVGKMIRIRVTHEEYPPGSGVIMERVGAISKAV